jgi:beta-lactamase regulating signal transducer with metallopeptidase domain
LTREAADRLGLNRLPEVRIPEGARGAAVVGFLRLVVVLPQRLIQTATREEVGHVLLHELAHVKRRDPLLQLFCLVVQVVFWFHPCIWLARRRLSTLTELSCDQTVAAALGGSTAEYRRTLLRLARPMLLPQPFGSLAFLRRRSQLLLRMEWLERRESSRRGKAPPGTALTCLRRSLAVGLGTLVLLCCAPVARPPADWERFTPPPLESLQGCLQLRYAVQAEIARRSPDHVRLNQLVSGRRRP